MWSSLQNRSWKSDKHWKTRLLAWFVFSLIQLPITQTDAATNGFFFASQPVLNLVSKTFTSCTVPLTECPQTQTARTGREICLFGHKIERCKTGTHYACGNDTTTGFLVEGCFERKICSKGQFVGVRLDIRTETAKLQCEICNNTTYQPFPKDSVSQTGLLEGCMFTRYTDSLKAERSKMRYIEKGWPTGPDRYSCDTRQGYSDVNGKMYCHAHDMCHCTKNFRCLNTTLPDLLPDGTCARKCEIDRDEKNNYTCDKYSSSDIPYPEDETPVHEKTSLSLPMILVLAVAALGTVIGMAVLAFRVYKNRCRRDCDAENPGPDINNGGDIIMHEMPDNARRADEHDENIANGPRDGADEEEPLMPRGQGPAQADAIPFDTPEPLPGGVPDESLTEAVQEQGGVSITDTDGASGHDEQRMADLKLIDEENTDDIPDDNTSPKQYFGDSDMER